MKNLLFVFISLFIFSLQVRAAGVIMELDTTVIIDSFTYAESDPDLITNPVVFDVEIDLIDPFKNLVAVKPVGVIGTLSDLDSDADGYLNAAEDLIGTEKDDAESKGEIKALNYDPIKNFTEEETQNLFYIQQGVIGEGQSADWAIVDINQEDDLTEFVLQGENKPEGDLSFAAWVPEVEGDIYFQARVVGEDDCCEVLITLDEKNYGVFEFKESQGWVNFRVFSGSILNSNDFNSLFTISFVNTSGVESNNVLQVKNLFAASTTSDVDLDGLPDKEELLFGLNPETPFLQEGGENTEPTPNLSEDADADFDGDKLTNIDELKGGESNWTEIDTDHDGKNDNEDDLPSNPLETVDTDKDGKGNNEDLDDDNDSIPDAIEVLYDFLDPEVASDGSDDFDLDGVSNAVEYRNGTNLIFDDYGPLIVGVPEKLRIESTGALTGVDFSQVLARDGEARTEVPVWQLGEAKTYFEPGVHTITWVTFDGPNDFDGNPSGNKTEKEQTITVIPLVSFNSPLLPLDGSSSEGDICLVMNGVSLTYPINVELSIKGNDVESETLSIVFNDNEVEACSTNYNFSNFKNGDDIDAVISIEDVDKAAFLGNEKQEVVIDLAQTPILHLTAAQNGIHTRTFLSSDVGNVSLVLNIDSDHSFDDLIIDWSETDNRLIDIDGSANNSSFIFDPTGLNEDTYLVKVGVVQNQLASLPVVYEMLIRVINNSTDKSFVLEVDSDFDGISDSSELTSQENTVSSASGVSLLTQQGLSVQLGDDAFKNGNFTAEMTLDDFIRVSGLTPEGTIDVSSVISFDVRGLSVAGSQAFIVVKLEKPLETTAGYYKLKDGAWVSFDVTGQDYYASTASVSGICPDPSSPLYRKALTLSKGNDCIFLAITDGGPNDDDLHVNGAIKDPGGVGDAPVVTASEDDSNIREPVEKAESGSLGYLMGMILLALCFNKLRTKKKFA